jgi:transposase-like protein
MRCMGCGSAAVSERLERTAQGYRRFRCRSCGKPFNERSGGALNRAQFPSDIIALVVLWRLRYQLSLRDLSEVFLLRGIVFSHEAVRDWEAKLTPGLAENLRRRRRGKVGRSCWGGPPQVTDGLRSYGVARRALLPDVTHRTSRYLNNRAENSHRPTRRRERQMQRFKSPARAQDSLSAHAIIYGHFRPRRHRLSAVGCRRARSQAFRTWRQETSVLQVG